MLCYLFGMAMSWVSFLNIWSFQLVEKENPDLKKNMHPSAFTNVHKQLPNITGLQQQSFTSQVPVSILHELHLFCYLSLF